METFRCSFVAAVVFASLACARASEAPAPAVTPAAVPQSAAAPSTEIEHVAPRRDSVGAQPKEFEWTAVSGADGYAFLLVTEIDIEVWETPVRTNKLEVPKELVLDGGTYYWAVGAFRNGRQVAYSGRAAFVVLK